MEPAPVEVSPGRRYRPGPGVSTRPLGAELILVQLDEGTTFRLNATGVIIWQLCQAGRNLEEIVAHLGSEYDVPASQLEHEARGLLAQLLVKRLLLEEPEG